MADARLWTDPGEAEPRWHERPDATTASEAAIRLADEVRRLVESHHFDESTVEEVRERASSAELLAAADWIDFMSTLEEVRVDNLAYRLLIAAATGDPLRELSPADAGRLAEIEELDRMTPAGAFDVLARDLPRLRVIETEVLDAIRLSEPLSVEEEVGAWTHIESALADLVGPTASGGSGLTRSLLAFGMCRLHLGTRVGLPINFE